MDGAFEWRWRLEGCATGHQCRSEKPQKWTTVINNVAFLYGNRPRHVDVWYLSPYEFVCYWEVVLARYPLTAEEHDESLYHARLTPRGEAKMKKNSQKGAVELKAGVDYVVKDSGGNNWVPLPENAEAVKDYRHTWVLQRRRRPKDPSFMHCPMPRRGPGQQERTAALLMTYFHPFTLCPELAEEHVPYLGELKAPHPSWHSALRYWLDGRVLCEEAKRYLANFMVVTRARPDDDEHCNSDNSDDIVSDEELELCTDNLAEALETRVGGRPRDDDAANAMAESAERSDAQCAFGLAEAVWAQESCGRVDLAETPGDAIGSERLKHIFGSATTSQRKEVAEEATPGAHGEASLRVAKVYSAATVRAWLADVRARKDARGQPTVKDAQFSMLKIVVDRICVELQEVASCATRESPLRGEPRVAGSPVKARRKAPDPGAHASEPLLWCLLGGPGTGKSYVLKLIKQLFAEVMGWGMGVDFQMAALQAVMADQIGGDTIHHALGIRPFGQQLPDSQESQRQASVAKQVLQWRWLIIDEISMVSPQLLAEIDLKLRDVVRRVGSLKAQATGIDRAFGGINVLLAGDFWQLEPPSGGFLGAIPVEYIRRARQYDVAATVSHGQAIFWGKGAGCVQGMTELTECVRTDDDWLFQVQNEIRNGALSETNYNFLHGMPTRVPGSWVNGHCSCGRLKCMALELRATKASTAEEAAACMAGECAQCKAERVSRCRVVSGASDERLLEEKFIAAPAVFPNNDIKYDVNKRRGAAFAARTGQAITWVPARDRPGTDTIKAKPSLTAEKLYWLQRHDKDCGGLYGMVPLVKGMPVALVDHIDRNPEKQLLRGRVGHVDSWVLHSEENSKFQNGCHILKRPPLVVFVRFQELVGEGVSASWQNCSWVVGDLPPGIYPIRPWKRRWFLDNKRKYPMLPVFREQLPLAPAFAITAHGAQGQTLPAAIVELQIGRGVSIIASYVAITRVRRRQDVLIFRKFDRDLFMVGSPTGPSLLMRVLRGEAIDWKALEDKFTPHRTCVGCGEERFKDEFGALQFKKLKPWCKSCILKKQDAGTPLQCSRCDEWGSRDWLHCPEATRGRAMMCKGCAQQASADYERSQWRKCSQCSESKPHREFSDWQWRKESGRICSTCSGEEVSRQCVACKKMKHCGEFSDWQWRKESGHVCSACSGEEVTRQCVTCKKIKPRGEFSDRQWRKESGHICSACSGEAVSRECVMCKKIKPCGEFSDRQWRKESGHICSACSGEAVSRECVMCKEIKPYGEFSDWQWRKESGHVCSVCSGEKASRQCVTCKKMKPYGKFSDWQWRKESGHVCSACSGDAVSRQCVTCNKMKPYGEFSDWQWRKASGHRCSACSSAQEMRQCSACGQEKARAEFSAWQWRKDEGSACQSCISKERPGKAPSGTWTCGKCHQKKAHHEFSRCARSYRGTKKGRCDACTQQQESELRAQWDRTRKHVI